LMSDELALREIKQRQALHIPRQVMYRIRCRKNCRAPWRKGKSNKTRTCDSQRRLAVRHDPHNAAFPRKRGGDIKVPVSIESQTLWSSQPAVEHRNRAVRINFV